jgi:lipopolysaccharide export system permease protein
MLRQIDRYVFARLLGTFALFALLLIAVYWINRAAELFNTIIGDGGSFRLFLELSVLTLPNVIRVVLPIAAFAAAVQTGLRLTRDNEMVVLQGTGLSFVQMMRPVILFGLVVALMMVGLMNALVPLARAKLTERQVEIAENITARLLRPGDFLEPARGVVVFIGSITEDGELRDMFLTDSRDSETRTEYTAERALLVPGPNGPVLLMLQGTAIVYNTATGRILFVEYDDLSYDLGGLVGPRGDDTDVRDLPTQDLLGLTQVHMDELGVTRAAVRFELASRLAQPLLAILTAMIGLSAVLLGEYSRLGAWRQIALALACLLLIQLVTNATTAPALRDDRLWWLAFVPVGLAALFALALLGWSARRRRVAAGPAISGHAA